MDAVALCVVIDARTRRHQCRGDENQTHGELKWVTVRCPRRGVRSP
ncbi:MAG: hypothetical protein AVDCRST_MAG70-1993 [uncultured Thermomicrobiales bacterium]|uniref:Uncharacterized protein n=1 Tax=uncultured Thermomicrobiales bacterium TaxID=1645740 RepID=A0A6J4V0Y2_9BACT|nr:MAG: hypothetical protein AVDCRST_MAG70-1993 [uncultured Thermomicrobiales bacterium]